MRKSKFTNEQIIAHLLEIEFRQSRGESNDLAVKAIGITDQTHYRWRRRYSSLVLNLIGKSVGG